MVKAKVSASEAVDSTPLRGIKGVGATTLCDLAQCGFRFTGSTTLGQFKEATGSYEDLKAKLVEANIKGGYTLPKLQMLWGASKGKKRGREEAEGMTNKKAKVIEQGQDKNDPDSNFLLAPRGEAGMEDGDPEEYTEAKETPEVDALTRKFGDATAAVGTGDIQGEVCMSVIPDQTLNVSAPDKLISNPTEVLPDDPVPIIPGAAIGPNIASARHVAPQTLEEKQDDLMTDEILPCAKANGEKDIGGDGFGQGVINESKVDGEEEETKDAGVIIPEENRVGGKAFTVKKLDFASTPKFDPNDAVAPEKDWRTASRHPFRQPSLFRNHDMAVKVSKLISDTTANNNKLRGATLQAERGRSDRSWTRYNAATQGVAMAEMPLESSNYLARGIMTSDYQLHGPNPLLPTFPPSPFINERLSGRFH